jgi:hypothetical protein
VAVIGVAGCGSSGETSAASQPAADQDNAAAAVPGAEIAPPAAAKDATGQSQPGGQAQQAAQIEPQQRSIVYTATIAIAVKDVVRAADEAASIATGAGGQVGGDKRTLDGDRSEAQLILRVPADKFATTLTELAKRLGTEESRGVQTQDVTETIIDLDARLATQRASVDRVRALLAKAQTIGEVVSVESELTRREADLASLEQRKDKLAGLVSLSTITVSLHGPAAPAPAADSPDTGFLAGLRSGWSAFGGSIKVVLTVAGWLLPWAIAIGVPLWLVLYLLRRRRRPTLTPAPATLTPATPTPPPAP